MVVSLFFAFFFAFLSVIVGGMVALYNKTRESARALSSIRNDSTPAVYGYRVNAAPHLALSTLELSRIHDGHLAALRDAEQAALAAVARWKEVREKERDASAVMRESFRRDRDAAQPAAREAEAAIAELESRRRTTTTETTVRSTRVWGVCRTCNETLWLSWSKISESR